VAKNLIFYLLVNLIPAVCRFAAILPVEQKTVTKHHIFAHIASARCTIFPKFCTVIDLFVHIKEVVSFFDIMHSFSYRVHGKIRPI